MNEVWLVVPGTDDEGEGRPAYIEDETTVAELLEAAELDPRLYQLSYKVNDEQFGVLSNQDRVSDYVANGEKVFATPQKKMIVGYLA